MAASRRSWGAVRRVQPSGRWQVRWPDPETGRLTPGPRTFTTRTAAGKWLDAKRADLERGTAVEDRAAQRPLSFWWPAYERSLADLKESTRISYEAAWRLRIKPRFGGIAVRGIRPSDVSAWMLDLTEAGTSASKVHEACGVLKRVLDIPLRDRVITSNPCVLREGRLPRRPRTDRPVLSPADVERLTSAMRRDDDKLIVRLLAYGGLRIGEALALRVVDHDPVRHTLRVRESVGEVGGRRVVGGTKTYAVRTITLPESLSRQLAEANGRVAGQSEYRLMFPNRLGEHRRYRVWRRDSWDPATRTVGLTATPRDLRATCASLLIDAGASVKDVQQHLGHADVTTTMGLYARVRPGRSTDLAEKMNALLAEV